MNTKEPPKTKTILATPINVEESRAQRQQRSQARFRDRGGIFVPTNRNTLADILLGKAPPLKKPQRSVSASPSLNRQGKGISANGLRRKSSQNKHNASVRNCSESLLKQSRKSTHAAARDEVVLEDDVAKPKKAAASLKKPTTKPKAKTTPKTVKAKSTAKATAKRSSMKAAKKVEALDLKENEPSDDDGSDAPPPKSKTKTKAARISAVDDEDADGTNPPPKMKPKTKAASKKAARKGVERQDGAPTKPSVKQKVKTASKTGASTSKTSELLEVVDQQQTSNPKSSPIRAKLNTANVPAVLSSSATAGPSTSERPKPRKSGDLYSCGESEDEYVPKTSKKRPAITAKSKPSVANRIVPSASAKKTTAPLSDIMEEGEEEDDTTLAVKSLQSQPLPKATKPPKPKTTKKPTSSTKTKKRVAQDAELPDDQSEPPPKRAKTNNKTNAKSSPQDPKPNADSHDKPSKKRSRDDGQEDDDQDAPSEAVPKKSAKRKKVLTAIVPDPPELSNGSDMARAATGKRGSKNPSPVATKKTSSKPATRNARKENSTLPKDPELQPQVKRGPPKSVLLRIKESARTQVVDNDPDPIDFLS